MQESGLRDARDAALDLQTLLVAAAEVESFLGEVARRAADAVRRVQSCGITVQGAASSPVLGATTDELAYRMDAAQYEVDDGPCLACLRRGVPVSVPDIPSDQRWPAFTRRGAQEGAGSSLSVPLVVQEKTVGALNLYSRTTHGLSEADRTARRSSRATPPPWWHSPRSARTTSCGNTTSRTPCAPARSSTRRWAC